MTPFTVVTLEAPGGGRAGTGINGSYYLPGDILFTGSPSGSAKEYGGRWLKPGDRIHAEVSEVGVLNVTMRRD